MTATSNPPRPSGVDSAQLTQRARLLDAMARVVTEQGYDATTVADIVREARVSRRTFYEHFDDKEGCFVGGCWHGIALLFEAVDRAGRAQPDAAWRQTLRFSLESLLDALAAHPDYTWIITIESGSVRSAQPARAAVVEAGVDLWASLGAAIVAEEPGARALPRSTLRGLVGGIEALVRRCLVETGTRNLPAQLDDANAFALAVLESALAHRR